MTWNFRRGNSLFSFLAKCVRPLRKLLLFRAATAELLAMPTKRKKKYMHMYEAQVLLRKLPSYFLRLPQ